MDLHVATDGNDAWSGKLTRPNPTTTDGPLATLTGARDAIRKFKHQGPLTEAIHVIIADGKYHVTAPLELDSEDTGTDQAPILYEAESGARPVFSGGRVIRDWQLGTDGIWHTHISDVTSGHWYFDQLWVNGHRATRARTPNKFWFYMRDVQEESLAGQDKEARQTV